MPNKNLSRSRRRIVVVLFAVCAAHFAACDVEGFIHLELPPTSVVSAGYAHTVAVGTDGTLRTWGAGWDGALGNGEYGSSSRPQRIGTGWAYVSAGDGHTVAITSQGSIWAWGRNSSGQLGDGTTTNRNVPVRLYDRFWASSISAGNYRTAAIRAEWGNGSGSLWAWGSGHGNIPVQIGTDTNWVSVSAGGSIAAIRTDGTLWTLQSGIHARVAQVGTDNDWAFVSAGGSHIAAIKTNGTLWTWGSNSSGQLGDGTTTHQSSPVQVGTATTWASVSAGGSHTVGIRTDGSLWAWGRNNYGQLGDGTTNNRHTPIRIGTATNWASVSAGGDSGWEGHTVAIRTDGSLWAWGRNDAGQLGDGTRRNNRYSPVQIMP